MKKRAFAYAVWLALACILYFFENNGGTRVVLLCSLLLPAIPVIRRGLFEQDETSNQPRSIPQTVSTFAVREEDEPGDVRAYLPGDPVNRIHWKLSAKRDELLVREQAKERTEHGVEEPLQADPLRRLTATPSHLWVRSGRFWKPKGASIHYRPIRLTANPGGRLLEPFSYTSPFSSPSGKGAHNNLPLGGGGGEAAGEGQPRHEQTSAARRRGSAGTGRNGKASVFLVGFSMILLSLLLLLLIPSANQGMQALLNRLFDASEAVNAYVYDRYSVATDQSVWLAVFLLAMMFLSLLGMTLLSGSRIMALCLMAGAVLFQAYFGLSFPSWANVLLFALFTLWLLKRPWNKQTVLSVLAVIAAVSLAILLLWPGVDAGTETASEAVRDRLSQMVQTFTGTGRELAPGENETRHTHTQSLTAGESEAQSGKEYRLVTVEEEQISMPHWVNYLKIILLLLLTVALVILPFLPIWLVNQQRKKTLEARQVFQSKNVSEAVFAIFQQVIRWLEATGSGAGNLPYAQWTETVSRRFSPTYAQRFAACERLFEEAAYSSHEMKEEQREQLTALLNETEETLQRKAGWKQRLRLRYREWLWI